MRLSRPLCFQCREFDVYCSWLLFKRTSHLSKMPQEGWLRAGAEPGFLCLSLTHTCIIYRAHTGSHFFFFFFFSAVAAERNWALIGCLVPPKCDSKIRCREWQTGREDPVFDPQKSSEPPMGSLSCCAEHLLWCWINDWPAWTNSWRRERVWNQTSERCAAAASPSGSLEICSMVINFLFVKSLQLFWSWHSCWINAL